VMLPEGYGSYRDRFAIRVAETSSRYAGASRTRIRRAGAWDSIIGSILRTSVR
jgi:hypothetical protein